MISVPYSREPGWVVDFADEFTREFLEFNAGVQDELLAHIELLKQFGPHLGHERRSFSVAAISRVVAKTASIGS